MEIICKNQFNKFDILEIVAHDNNCYLVSPKTNNRLDITNLLDKNDLVCIRHTGRALGIVKDKEHINVCCVFNYHTHSHYSLLDGLSSVKQLAKKSSGVSAITDHGNMFNILKWQKAMDDEGKKAVFGFEAYLETIKGEKTGCHAIFLCKNEEGRKNAFNLTSNAFNNFYMKPHVSQEDLKKCKEGLIMTSACIGGELSQTLLTEGYEKALEVARYYKGLFEDDFYIEIQRHNFDDELKVNKELIKIANELNVKLVCANDSHFISDSDEKSHKTLLAVSYGKTVNEIQGFPGDGYHYLSDYELVNKFWDMPEVICNTLEMAAKCDTRIPTGTYHMPDFPVPDGYDADSYLCYLIDEGYKFRFFGSPLFEDSTYKERLEYEKSVIIAMGFSTYFLIVADYVNWAKEHGIYVGPGRGSGAGSLCLYCLRVTDVDPIKYSLKFERFLNPDRISMPDIDVDFEDSRRSEVIEYVKGKYGEENVCNIITFGTMQSKNAIRDAARALGFEVSLANQICKMIPDGLKLSKCLQGDEAVLELVELYNSDASVKEIINSALSLEGSPRQTSTHACGIVISDKAISEYMPTALIKDSKNKDTKLLASQVTMTEVEEMGSLKMDFLGLKTMSVIRYSVETINKFREYSHLEPIKDYLDIPLNDPYVYAEISEGQSFAVFQIESEGMRGFMKRLYSDVKDRIRELEGKYSLRGFGELISGPGEDKEGYIKEMSMYGEELFERMIAGVSLYRPGPMDYIGQYVDNIQNPQGIVYETPLLESILKPTYGIMVYQEQVIDTVKVLAGFSNGSADDVRRAMGKKKVEILEKYKPFFLYGSKEEINKATGKPYGIAGCIANGISEDIAISIWNKMEEFAKYAFNKSHACAYAMLSMRCAWLKHYYPSIYMTSVLNAYMDNNDKKKAYIAIAKNMGIEMLAPRINNFRENFSTNSKQILLGLKGLNGVSKCLEPIRKDVEDKGSFLDLQNFVARTYPLGVKKAATKSFILSGAFDFTGLTRRAMIESLDELYTAAKKIADNKKKENEDQLSFFEMLGVDTEDTIDFKINNIEEYPQQQLLNFEKEVTGLYISAHPLDSYKDTITHLGTTQIGLLYDDDGNLEETKVSLAGIITNLNVFLTKKGTKMAKFTLEDQSGSIACVVFPNDYETSMPYLKEDNCVFIKAATSDDGNFGPQAVVNLMMDLDSTPKTSEVESIWVRLKDASLLNDVVGFFKRYPGNTPVKVQVDNNLYLLNDGATASSSLFMECMNRYGTDNIKFI